MINNEDYCLICYEHLIECNYVSFSECGHIFCEDCFREILITNKLEYMRCPMDKRSVFKISVYKGSQLLLVEKSLNWYIIKNIPWLSEKMRDYFESGILHAMELIYNYKKFFNIYIDTKCYVSGLKKRYFEGILSKEECITRINSEKSNYYEQLEQFVTNIYDCRLDNVLKKVFNRYLTDATKREKIPKFINAYFNITQFIKITYCEKFSSFDLVSEMRLKRNLAALEEVSLYPLVLLLSNYSDNKEIYRSRVPDMKEEDIYRCLLCTEFIKMHKFASFYHCQHKVCISCLELYVISELCCPFDNNGISDLYIFYFGENVKIPALQYFIRNVKIIIGFKIKSAASTLQNYILEILNMKPTRDKTLYDTLKRMKKSVKNKEDYKNLIVYCDKICSEVMNKNFSVQINIFSCFYNSMITLKRKYNKTYDEDEIVSDMFDKLYNFTIKTREISLSINNLFNYAWSYKGYNTSEQLLPEYEKNCKQLLSLEDSHTYLKEVIESLRNIT